MSQSKTISFAAIQAEYPGKIVALNREETEVMAVGSSFEKVVELLHEKEIDPGECVYVGPVPKPGTVSV